MHTHTHINNYTYIYVLAHKKICNKNPCLATRTDWTFCRVGVGRRWKRENKGQHVNKKLWSSRKLWKKTRKSRKATETNTNTNKSFRNEMKNKPLGAICFFFSFFVSNFCCCYVWILLFWYFIFWKTKPLSYIHIYIYFVACNVCACNCGTQKLARIARSCSCDAAMSSVSGKNSIRTKPRK